MCTSSADKRTLVLGEALEYLAADHSNQSLLAIPGINDAHKTLAGAETSS